MGFLSSKGQWPTTDHGAQSTIFYARTFRLQVAVLLALIVLVNASIVIMAIVSTAELKYNEFDRETDKSSSGFKAKVFFFLVTIPAAILVESGLELYMRYKRTLQPFRAIVACCVSICLLCLAGGLWSPCIYPPWNVDTIHSTDYCPFNTKLGWGWIGKDATPRGPEFVMPWLLLPAAVLYIIYLGFAATAYHHVRKERRLNASTYNINYQHEMYPEDRLSYTPGVYAPGLYTASSDRAESMPLPPRSDVGSPVAPPKYMTRREVPLPSRVSSSRYTESLQSKRDSKGAACTCVNCPSHH